jgi:hypothetical protein
MKKINIRLISAMSAIAVALVVAVSIVRPARATPPSGVTVTPLAPLAQFDEIQANAMICGSGAKMRTADMAVLEAVLQDELAQVRAATARFHDLDAALKAGYELGWVNGSGVRIITGCISHPTAGAMGYHYFHPDLMDDLAVDPLEPEVLVYAPGENGKLRLVAVEYVVRGPDNFTRREFSYSSFKRAFTLPETVYEDKITASYNDVILRFTLPKKEEALPKPNRMIEIAK